MTATSPSKDTLARGVAGSTQSSSVSKTFSSSSGSRPTSARRATRAKFRRPRLGAVRWARKALDVDPPMPDIAANNSDVRFFNSIA